MPRWLKTVLLAGGLLILAAFLIEPALLAGRRRRQRALRAHRATTGGSGRDPGPARPATEQARIVVADHDRLVVTCSQRDQMVYVLRPPGADPLAILRVARLVLPEGQYGELAKQLGMTSTGPAD